LEFVVRRRLVVERGPCSGRPTGHGLNRQGRWPSIVEGQRRAAVQRRVAACRGVVNLELDELTLQVTAIPKQHVVEEFSPHRPNQALHEWLGQRYVRHGLDFVDLQNPKIGHPPDGRTLHGDSSSPWPSVRPIYRWPHGRRSPFHR